MAQIPRFEPTTRNDVPAVRTEVEEFCGPVQKQVRILTRALQGDLEGQNERGGRLRSLRVRHGVTVRITIDEMKMKPTGAAIIRTPYPCYIPKVEPIDEGILDLTVHFIPPAPAGDIPIVLKVFADSGVEEDPLASSSDVPSTPGSGVAPHDLVGPSHTTSGLTPGQVLRATGPTSFAFGGLQDGDIPSSIARDSEIALNLAAYQLESEKDDAGGYAGLDSERLVDATELGTGTPDLNKFLRGDRTWASVVQPKVKAAAVAFTDGDTMRRVTVVDADVLAGSLIVGTIRRPDILDENDPGYVYLANVVKVADGSFDLLLVCTLWGSEDPEEIPPSETVSFIYQIA